MISFECMAGRFWRVMNACCYPGKPPHIYHHSNVLAIIETLKEKCDFSE